MFDFDQINEYQLEITTYCNAACPQCPRNINGNGVDLKDIANFIEYMIAVSNNTVIEEATFYVNLDHKD